MADSSQVRLLAPLALVAFALACVVVIGVSVAGPDSPPGASSPTAQRRPARKPRRVYVVKRGDLLSTIAEKTGVSMRRLRDLNPSLDPQVLVPGQRVKLGR